MNDLNDKPIKFDCKVGLNMDIQVKTNPQGANEAAKILACGAKWLLILMGLAILLGVVLHFALPYFQAA